jgi:hypothetical protein
MSGGSNQIAFRLSVIAAGAAQASPALRLCSNRLPEALENQYDRCNT